MKDTFYTFILLSLVISPVESYPLNSGIETDWIEEEMSDDDDFRKDVIEQKIKKVVEEIGFTKKIVYKVEN